MEPLSKYPGDLCCTLFEDPGYEGVQQTFCLPDKTGAASYDVIDIGYDTSWWCGKNVAY